MENELLQTVETVIKNPPFTKLEDTMRTMDTTRRTTRMEKS